MDMGLSDLKTRTFGAELLPLLNLVRSPFISWHPTFLPYPTWLVISPREGVSVSCRNNGPGQLVKVQV